MHDGRIDRHKQINTMQTGGRIGKIENADRSVTHRITTLSYLAARLSQLKRDEPDPGNRKERRQISQTHGPPPVHEIGTRLIFPCVTGPHQPHKQIRTLGALPETLPHCPTLTHHLIRINVKIRRRRNAPLPEPYSQRQTGHRKMKIYAEFIRNDREDSRNARSTLEKPNERESDLNIDCRAPLRDTRCQSDELQRVTKSLLAM